MDLREHGVLERAVHEVAEQAAKTNTVIDEAMKAGLAADSGLEGALKAPRRRHTVFRTVLLIDVEDTRSPQLCVRSVHGGLNSGHADA